MGEALTVRYMFSGDGLLKTNSTTSKKREEHMTAFEDLAEEVDRRVQQARRARRGAHYAQGRRRVRPLLPRAAEGSSGIERTRRTSSARFPIFRFELINLFDKGDPARQAR